MNTFQCDRWNGIKRDWTEKDVRRLRGSYDIKHTIASCGANKLWNLINDDDSWVAALVHLQEIRQYNK